MKISELSVDELIETATDEEPALALAMVGMAQTLLLREQNEILKAQNTAPRADHRLIEDIDMLRKAALDLTKALYQRNVDKEWSAVAALMNRLRDLAGRQRPHDLPGRQQ